MISQSLLITVLGMGSVFFFLFLLICCIHVLSGIVTVTHKPALNKVALAVALAKQHRFKK